MWVIVFHNYVNDTVYCMNAISHEEEENADNVMDTLVKGKQPSMLVIGYGNIRF